MPLPVPDNPRWPAEFDTRNPETELLPLVDPDAGYFGQLWQWLTRRPRYRITRDYFTWIPSLQAWCYLSANFVMDYASIPRFFGFMLRPAGLLSHGAPPHDHGYRFGGLVLSFEAGSPYRFVQLPRDQVDDAFQSLNLKTSKLKKVVALATAAVRIFAGKKYGKENIEDQDWTQPV